MIRRGLLTSTTSVLSLALLACGGEQRSGAAPADTTQATAADTSPPAAADTGIPSVRDTSSTPRPESTVTRRDTAPKVAAKPPAPKPVRPKPTAPAPVPSTDTTARADTAQPAAAARPSTDTGGTTSQPANPTRASPATQGNAPLRDPYHRAPLDTVSQQVYDGWKQFNLNCARCHGEDVQGTTIAPHLLVSLRPDGPINTKELFVQTVCAGRPAKGMPAWCALGMEMPTIEAIYSYVKGRSDAKIHPGRPALKSGG